MFNLKRKSTLNETEKTKSLLKGNPGERFILSNNYAINETLSRKDLCRNKNLLVVGTGGTGKDQLIANNLLDLKDNKTVKTLIILDPFGEQKGYAKKHLEEIGYKTIYYNPWKDESIKFNPLAYCKTEAEVLALAQNLYFTIIPADSKEREHAAIYDFLSLDLLEVILLYMFHNHIEFYELVQRIEDFPNNQAEYHAFYNITKNISENKSNLLYKKAFKNYCDLLLSSPNAQTHIHDVVMGLAVQLHYLKLDTFKESVNDKTTPLKNINEKPLAIFIGWNEGVDKDGNFLSTLFLNECINQAHLKKENDAPVTRIILNELSNLPTPIEWFVFSWISTAYRYNIEYQFYFRSLSELEKKFPDNVNSILGNCDFNIFLDSDSYIEYAGKEEAVAPFYGNKTLIKIRGCDPIIDEPKPWPQNIE